MRYEIINYKGFEITTETYKGQTILRAYKFGNLYEKQRYIYYTENEAIKIFKNHLKTTYNV